MEIEILCSTIGHTREYSGLSRRHPVNNKLFLSNPMNYKWVSFVMNLLHKNLDLLFDTSLYILLHKYLVSSPRTLIPLPQISELWKKKNHHNLSGCSPQMSTFLLFLYANAPASLGRPYNIRVALERGFPVRCNPLDVLWTYTFLSGHSERTGSY